MVQREDETPNNQGTCRLRPGYNPGGDLVKGYLYAQKVCRDRRPSDERRNETTLIISIEAIFGSGNIGDSW